MFKNIFRRLDRLEKQAKEALCNHNCICIKTCGSALIYKAWCDDCEKILSLPSHLDSPEKSLNEKIIMILNHNK